MPMQRAVANPARKSIPNYGLRPDGTPKGKGWLGEIPHTSGKVMTEYSIGVDFDGKETLIPTLVPTLDKNEIKQLQNINLKGGKLPKNIMDKAVQHAIEQMKQGKSPFKD